MAGSRREYGWLGGGARAKALVVLLSTFVAFAMLEAAARWWLPPPRTHDAPLEVHGSLGFRGVPGYRERARDEAGEFELVLDAEGRRALPPSAAAGRKPVELAFFGDSFLVGRGLRVEALFPARVVELLAEDDVVARARNFAVIGHGTAQQLLAFRESLKGGDMPDGVVLAFYTGNDIVNNEPRLAGKTMVSAGDYLRPYLEPPDFEEVVYLHPWRARLRNASRLFATLENRLLAQRPGGPWLRPFAPIETHLERQQAGRPPREALEVLRAPPAGSDWEAGWERTLGLLRAFADEARAVGARFLVVVIPMQEQVQHGAKVVAYDWMSRQLGQAPLDALLDWTLPERRLSAWFEAERIDARFLAPALRESAAAGRPPYARDRHLDATGHALAAEAVLAWWLGGVEREVSDPGQPVGLLPSPAMAPERLDFEHASQAAFLGDGWLGWRAAREGRVGGWRVGPRSLAVLPDRGGEVVLRGHAGPESAFPFAVTIALPSGRSRSSPIVRPGAFELRLARSARRAREAYTVVLVGQDGPLDNDVRIQALWIEAAAGEPTPRRN